MSTTTDTLFYRPAPKARPRLGNGMAALLHAIAKGWQRRRAVSRLARVEPRLLRDMGFDPAAIQEAARHSWDEVEPGRYHGYERE